MVFLEGSFRLAGQEKIDELLRPFLVFAERDNPRFRGAYALHLIGFNFTFRFYPDTTLQENENL